MNFKEDNISEFLNQLPYRATSSTYKECNYKEFLGNELPVINTKLHDYLNLLPDKKFRTYFLLAISRQLDDYLEFFDYPTDKAEKVKYLLGYRIYKEYKSRADCPTDTAFQTWMQEENIDKYVFDRGKFFKEHKTDYIMNNQQNNTFNNSPNNNLNFGNNNSITGGVNITINNNGTNQPDVAERKERLRQYGGCECESNECPYTQRIYSEQYS